MGLFRASERQKSSSSLIARQPPNEKDVPWPECSPAIRSLLCSSKCQVQGPALAGHQISSLLAMLQSIAHTSPMQFKPSLRSGSPGRTRPSIDSWPQRVRAILGSGRISTFVVRPALSGYDRMLLLAQTANGALLTMAVCAG